MYGVNPVDEFIHQPIDALVTINASPFYVGKTIIRRDIARSISSRLECPLIYVNQVGGNDELIFDGQSFAVDSNGEFIAMAKGFSEDNLVFDIDDTNRVEASQIDDTIDLHDALILGTRDYVSKSVGNPAVFIALSGGIDSAVSACVASRAVGPENVHGFGMPSLFSSEGSIEDARLKGNNKSVWRRSQNTDCRQVLNIWDWQSMLRFDLL
jgi:hypothetical protein